MDGYLFPAHAGVIPLRKLWRDNGRTFPRACGGDPRAGDRLPPGDRFSPRMRG